jgi:hypothetical protein
MKKNGSNAQSCPKDSWYGLEADFDALPIGPAACDKGPSLRALCAAVEHLAGIQPPADAVVVRSRCFLKVMQLLAGLLIARRRARDWKQQDFSSNIVAVLAAATAVLRCSGSQSKTIQAKISVRLLTEGLLGLVAAAQREITQLLSTQHSQQPGDQQQKQQRQQQQGQAQLLQVAQQLLLWWLEAHQLWQHNPARVNLAKATTAAAAEGCYAHHVQAVELAAAMVHAARHNCTSEQFLVLAQVGPTTLQQSTMCITPLHPAFCFQTQPVWYLEGRTGTQKLVGSDNML